VEAILRHRYLTAKSKRPAEFQVKWRGYPVSQASWRTFKELQGCKQLLEEYAQKQGLQQALARLQT
jgi:formylglycine-generating enzyme required for sulfatase activity